MQNRDLFQNGIFWSICRILHVVEKLSVHLTVNTPCLPWSMVVAATCCEEALMTVDVTEKMDAATLIIGQPGRKPVQGCKRCKTGTEVDIPRRQP